ncbi:MAG: dockerin type I repeat-containing protein [Ruminococcus sp.]|nr:dockerin type I repeat-containing protein [Ruminococcus sp.]
MKKLISLLLVLILVMSCSVSSICAYSVTEEEKTEIAVLNESESPIEKLEFEPITIIEGTNSEFHNGNDWETGEYYEYYWYFPENLIKYTITWSDGTVTSGSDANVVYDGQSHRIDIDTNQSSSDPWTVGNTYTITAQLLGVTEEIPVSIVKAPIKNMEIKPFVLTEKIHSIQSGSYYPLYDYVDYAITWEDGRTTIGKGSSVSYNGKKYYFSTRSNQSDIDWEAGNTYTTTVALMGVTTEVPVTIEECPVENVTLIKDPDKTHYEQGQWVNPEGAVLRVDYSDGTYEDMTIGNCRYTLIALATTHMQRYDCDLQLVVQNPFAEKESYIGSILGFDIEFPSVYSTRTITQREIQNDGYELIITDTYSDGQQKTRKAVSYTYREAYTDSDYIVHYYVLLKTDDGVYFVQICRNYFGEEVYISSADVVSNTISNCPWFDLQQRVRVVNRAINVLSPSDFDGEITEDNIDDLVSIAIYAKGLQNDYQAVIKETQYKGESIKSAFYDVYGVIPDLTLSEGYNADNDTYTTAISRITSSAPDPSFTVEYTDDVMNVYVEKQKLHMSFDKDMYLNSFYYEKPEYLIGDADGDGELSVLDASLIQMYLVGKKTLEGVALKAADADLDGEVSVMDASLIQMVLVGKKQI